MGKQIRMEFISDGFKEILKSDGVKTTVAEQAEQIRDRANSGIGEDSEGFAAETIYGNYGGGRWIGFVQTTDYASMKAEAEEKALSRAVR